jgi:hypothetical protein
MKFSFAVAGAILPGLLAPARGDLLVQPHDVVMVSAETQGGSRVVSVDLADYLLMCQPVEDVQVVQSCIPDDSIEAFMKRVDSDIAPWHPNVVLISHGAAEGHGDPQSRDFTYYHPTYLGKTVDELKAAGARVVVLGTSACVDPTYFHDAIDAKTFNANLAAYGNSDRALAVREGVPFADIITPMLDALPKIKALYGDSYMFDGPNGYRPSFNSQLIMAYAFLKALGCDGAIGTITVDLAANTAEGTPGQKIISCQNGTVEVESTRYPFCFQGDPAKPESTSGIIQAFPFNDELNRYLLVVKGLTGSRAKVTWGAQSQEFATADLARGVNLAAAFATHTPFNEQFVRVENAVTSQQALSFLWTNAFFHYEADYRQMAPSAGDAIDQANAGILADNHTRTAAAAALVVPIRHTLKIEALP